MVRYLEDHGLVPDGKHGFRSFRSTLTQVLAANSYKGWKGEDVIYTDFAKPFDTVKTCLLQHELRDCGVKGKLGCWLAVFLQSPEND